MITPWKQRKPLFLCTFGRIDGCCRAARPLLDMVESASQITTGDPVNALPVLCKDDVGVLASANNVMTDRLQDSIDNLEERVAERTRALEEALAAARKRTRLMETGARVSREITSILHIDELIPNVVRLFEDAFYPNTVDIFLVEGDVLMLRSNSKEKSQQNLRIRLDTTSLNSEAVKTNRVVLVNDTSKDSHFLYDQSNPGIRSELVIPLQVANNVIGTLDIHSTSKGAFTEDDILVFQSLGDQIAIAIENARLYERSGEYAILDERTRLSRELHDSVIQSLYSLCLLAEGWRRLIQSGQHDDIDLYLGRVGEIAHQALKEMRLLIHELRPPPLEEEGLLSALQHRLEAVELKTGIQARVVAEDLGRLPMRFEDAFYGIAKEALNNALKHSGADQVTVRILQDEKKAVLKVVDNGCGFETMGNANSGGLGLTVMRERAEAVGGRLSVLSFPGWGTTVKVIVTYNETSTKYTQRTGAAEQINAK
ncbi:MAG: GAF domain-containing protein [Anaerolineales bacterium]|nr:GAF domain-containing protein [Anaerolineales bacterium]